MSEEMQDQVDQEVQEKLEAVEKEARLGGWVPKEEFRDGDHWVDAETFVRRGKEINPILRKNNESLLKKLEEANKEIAEVKQVAKEFEKFQKENATRQVAELSRQIAELKDRKKEAISLGDGDGVVAIDDAIDVLKEQQQQTKVETKKEIEASKQETAEATVLDPTLVTWMEDNKWFTSDMKMTAIADAIGTQINKDFPNLKGKAFLEKLDEELEEVLPTKYKKTQRTSPVEGSTSRTNRTTSSKSRSYDNLPADAKAAADRFVKQGLMTIEQYVADYDWS